MNDHEALITRYKQLLNDILPATFAEPIRHNHCFNRVILDWLFQGVWYDYLNQAKTAVSQLDDEQLRQMITRMEQWLIRPELLFQDNQQSLDWRRKVQTSSETKRR